jgi:hypothetical protein
MGLAMAVMAVAPSLTPAQASQTTPQDVSQVYALVNIATFVQSITGVCQQRNTEMNLGNICDQINSISIQAAHNAKLLIYSVNGTFPNNFKLTHAEQCALNTLLNFPYNSEGGFVTGVDLGWGISGPAYNTAHGNRYGECGLAVIGVPRYHNGHLGTVWHVIGLNDILNQFTFTAFPLPTPYGNVAIPTGFGILNVGMQIAQTCGSLGFNASVRSWCRSYYNTLAFESNTVQNYVTFNFGNVPFN